MSTEEIGTKALGPLTVTNADKGYVEAIVATLNVVDRDRDVILPGAVKDGSGVKLSSYGHSSALFGDAPVGKGVLTEENGRLMLRGQFFMSTERGREAFATVKELGTDGEWSVGYRPRRTATMTDEWRGLGAKRLLAEMDVFEASPVLQGASPFTATVVVKAAEADEATRDEAVEEARVAEGAEERRLADEAETKRLAEEAEAKRLADEAAAAQAVRVSEAMAEYHRVQRALKRMGLAA